MPKLKILAVDDEPAILNLIRQLLLRHGYEVFTAGDGDAALNAAYDLHPDLILLDLMLPGMDGWEVCRRIKADPELKEIPVLMLTARRDERDLVEGLNLGADDYVRKPFSTAELGARIAAILRRYAGTGERGRWVRCGELEIDRESGSAFLRGRELNLSTTEFRLLEHLAGRYERTVSREHLLSDLWRAQDCSTRTVDVHISRLRRKLDDGVWPRFVIQSHRGRGYRLLQEALNRRRGRGAWRRPSSNSRSA